MKKISFVMLFISALLMGVTFTGCGSDDEPTKEQIPTPGDPTPGPIIDPELPASLQGTNYYIFQLDGINFEKIQNKVAADFREDMATGRSLMIWPDGTSYVGNSNATGPNFYGEVEGWVALQVGTIGWSGGGFNCAAAAGDGTPYNNGPLLDKLANIMASPQDYYFHIALKSKNNDNASHVFRLPCVPEVANVQGLICFGTETNEVAPYANYARDGEWHEFEIPMTYFTNQGLVYRTGATTANVLTFGSGSVAGNELNIDACFIYKKN